jgi:hypothetical protein
VSSLTRNQRLYFSSSNQITNIDKEQMEEILEDLANAGRDGTGYVVIDVRNPDEIAATGNLSPQVLNLPLPLIMQVNKLLLGPFWPLEHVLLTITLFHLIERCVTIG